MTKRLGGVRAGRLVVTVVAVLASTGCESARQTELDVAVSEQGLFGTSTCPAGSNIIQGTSSANTLTGTAGVDCILGNGGNDTISGLGGNDTLIGGAGTDTIYGGDGNDRIEGETDADFLYGEAGDDKIYGSGGNDDIEGGDGADEISGLDGGDDIWGGAGNDLIRGESSTDNIWGDDGDDVIFGGTHADTIRGGNGRDVILGEDANDILYGEANDDYLIGGAGNNTIDGGTGNDACTGTSCEAAAPVPNGCTSDANCAANKVCVVPAGLCIACSDGDADGTCDSVDLCAADPAKVAPGQCGCGAADTDGDGDGTANCNDGCPADAAKVAAGVCGCGVSDADGDSDGTPNCNDLCPADAGKVAAGVCGCGVADTDSDGDGTANCNDGCPADAMKVAPGICGCGAADTDSDGDGTANCNDGCPADAAKVAAGVCGCGVADTDSDSDGTANCNDGCPADAVKVAAGICGCGVSDVDGDSDGTADCNDGCPADAAKLAAGQCGCGVADTDSDGDGTANCNDACPTDATKLAAGVCGCGVSDADGDSDGTADCNDGCPSDAAKLVAGVCGCGVSDADGDGDGIADCDDVCPGGDDAIDADSDGVPDDCDLDGGCNTSSSGPGVYQGDVYLNPYTDDSFLAGITCIVGHLQIGVRDGSPAALSSLRGVTGVVEMAGTHLTDLAFLSSLRSVGAHLMIGDNPDLQSLSGLEALRFVGWSVGVFGSPLLTDLSPLSTISSLGSTRPPDYGQLMIANNASLSQCAVWALEDDLGVPCGAPPNPWGGATLCDRNTGTASCGQLPAGFACVPGASGPGVYDGDLTFEWDMAWGGFGYYPQALLPVGPPAEYGGLTCVTGNLSITGSPLVDLSAFPYLEQVGGTLALFDNAYLPTCRVEALEAQTGKTCGRMEGSTFVPCAGNTGVGSCEALPQSFACVPGASGPGVHDGSLTFAWDALAEGWSGDDPMDYIGTRCITGDVTVSGLPTWGTIAVDLSFLGALEMVGGDLRIEDNPGLTNLDGLDHLTHVGGLLDVSENELLTEVWALGALESVSAFDVHDNDNLPWCWVGYVEWVLDQYCVHGMAPGCEGNTGRGTCGPLPAEISCAPDAKGPGVYDGDLAVGGTDSQLARSHRGLTCVTGDLEIVGSALTELNGLRDLQYVAGDLVVAFNDTLENVDGLEALESVGGQALIGYNPALEDLLGLSGLSAVGELAIVDNPTLAACWVAELEGSTGTACDPGACDGNLGAASCDRLPTSFACVPGASGPGVFDGSFYVGYTGDLDALTGIECVTGDLSVSWIMDTNLEPLSRLRWVGGNLDLNYAFYLTDLDDLDHLVSVGGYFQISQSGPLSDAHGLWRLASVGGYLAFLDNYSLPQCWADRVEDAVGQVASNSWGNYGADVCY